MRTAENKNSIVWMIHAYRTRNFVPFFVKCVNVVCIILNFPFSTCHLLHCKYVT
ncbi:hypothetical protein HanIR_Chr01g0024531 [Helianthus annuus]|nr:hypothetical protein HanIR_Chr01g0024531 [Helianthus annuus]